VFVGKVVNLYDLGLTVEEIAKRLDTSELIVEKVIDDYNLEDDA
jgi:DNA-binding NarL/FixJ family response regulator